MIHFMNGNHYKFKVDPGLLADPVRGNPAGFQFSVYMGLH